MAGAFRLARMEVSIQAKSYDIPGGGGVLDRGKNAAEFSLGSEKEDRV